MIAKKFVTATLLGLNSGIAFALLNATTTAYFKNLGLDLILIGLLALRMTPYSLKYLWAPLVDGLQLKAFSPDFGQRKSWIITMQLILFLLIFSLGFIDVRAHLTIFMGLIVLAVFTASTHDIAMEAYRIELFKDRNTAKGNSCVVLGYRLGFFISSVIGLFLVDFIGWQLVYRLIAFTILPCTIMVLITPDKYILTNKARRKFKHWFKEQVIAPLIIIKQMKNLAIVLMIIAFYKMSDGYLDAMLIPFLLETGFNNTEISIYSNAVGNFAFITGTIVASKIIGKINVFKLMLIAEIFAAGTNLLFLIITIKGKIPELLALINLCENFCSGVCNIMLITYVSSLCHHKFNATHYSLLMCITGITKTLTSSSSGYVAATFGWEKFFIISALMSIPSLICLAWLAWNTRNTKSVRTTYTQSSSRIG